MKKILCLVPYTFLPALTGGQKSINSFYQNLAKHFELVCVGTKDNDNSKAIGYKMYNILSASVLRYINFLAVFKIRRIIHKERPDYLQIEHPYLGWLAITLKRITGIKLIVRSHNIEGLRFKNLHRWWWKILLFYEGWVHRQADINYFITDADRTYALKAFALSPLNTFTITYGINLTDVPSDVQRQASKAFLRDKYKFDGGDLIILFNGAFDYTPNLNALINLVNRIFPQLKMLQAGNFKLVVCGKDIPEDLIKNNKNPDIVFAGFVSDINAYLSGACVFVNPITEGGGIKTKLVEALGFNLNCVSFKTGAIGIPVEICGGKLIIVDDNDCTLFARAIIEAGNITSDIPAAFYNYFSNEKILEKIIQIL
ncbi:glycosyltransferase family 4 protein [Segetibacter koreensis]|uniref:glycosyltransferase family 4 protein n=1 Tax=Segetibacter koreensis TaxID=398037 RepID=UPI0003793AE6|nr:glycosyltransferase family 4 protein [Segetibacter koreensis]